MVLAHKTSVIKCDSVKVFTLERASAYNLYTLDAITAVATAAGVLLVWVRN